VSERAATGYVSYFFTAEELFLLGRIVLGKDNARFGGSIPAVPPEADWEAALLGLTGKGYVSEVKGGVVYDRVMGAVIRVIAGSDVCFGGGDGGSRLFVHKKAVVYLCEDRRAARRYRIVPMSGIEDFENSGYYAEMGEKPWKKC
jgi:hypothetical protein